MKGVRLKEVGGRYVLVVERFRGREWVRTEAVKGERTYREKEEAMKRMAVLRAI